MKMGRHGSCLILLPTLISLSSANVNLVVVMEEGNSLVQQATEAALKLMENTVEKTAVLEVVQDHTSETLELLCGEVDKMIDEGTPPDLIVDLTSRGTSSDVIQSLTASLGIPTVTASSAAEGDLKEWSGLSSSQEKYLLQVRPPGDILPEVIRSLVQNTRISSVAVLYDETFDIGHKGRRLIQDMHVLNTLERIDESSENSTRDQLFHFEEDLHIMNFVILGSMENINRVFSLATAHRMFGGKYYWFAGTKESGAEFDASCCEEMQVTFFSPKSPSSAKMSSYKGSYGLTAEPEIDAGFYFDLVAKSATAVQNMKDSGSWPEMAYTKCTDFTSSSPIERNLDLLSAFKSVSLGDAFGPMDIHSNGLSSMKFDLTVTLYDVYERSTTSRNEIGVWTAGVPGNMMFQSGMENTLPELKNKRVYRVATALQPPFMMRNANGEFEGFCKDMLDEIKKKTGLAFELYEVPDERYGRQDEDTGLWNGVMGELVDHTADIGIGAISITATREVFVDFTIPFYDMVGLSIMMKLHPEDLNIFKFLIVMDNTVWACVIATFFAISALLAIFDKFSPYSYQNIPEKYENDMSENKIFNFRESMWFCFTSMTAQGGGDAPKTVSGRLVAAAWWLFGFIFIASYTANLAAFLTVGRIDNGINSLDDLGLQSGVYYGPVNHSATFDYFDKLMGVEVKFYVAWKDLSVNEKYSYVERAKLAVWEDPVPQRIHDMDFWSPDTFEEGLQWVRESETSTTGFALISDADTLRYLVLTNCDLKTIGDDFAKRPYGMAVQQGSKLKDRLDDAINQLQNERLFDVLKEKWWNKNPNRAECPAESDGQMTIDNIGGAFIVIGLGLVLSFISLGFEYWYYKDKQPESAATGVSAMGEFAKQD